MGIYYTNWLYHGRLLRSETYKKIKNDILCKDNFLTHLYGDTYILHVPNRCFTIGWIDPVIEEYEIKQGFIDKKEVFQKLKHDVPDKWNLWQSAK